MNNKKNILFILPHVSNVSNGLSIITIRILTYLEKNKYNIFIICNNIFYNYIKNYNLKAVHINYDLKKINIRLLLFLPFIIKKYKINIIQGSTPKSDVYLLFIKNVKIYNIIHGLYSIEKKQYNFFSLIKLKIFYYILKHKSNKVIALSKSTANDIIKETNIKKNKIKIINTGINTNKYKPNKIKKISNKIIISGRLSKEKRPLIGLEVAKKLKNMKISFNIDYYGVGELYDILYKKIKYYDLNDYINLKGFKDDMSNIYNKYDVMLHFCKHESFSLSIIEALSSGIPVICYPGGGNLDIIIDGINGYFYDKKNEINSIVNILYNLFTDQNKLYYLKNNARKIALKKLSQENFLKNIEKVYNKE